jgi:hypothetical protein
MSGINIPVLRKVSLGRFNTSSDDITYMFGQFEYRSHDSENTALAHISTKVWMCAHMSVLCRFS